MGLRVRPLESVGVISDHPAHGFWSGKRVLITGHTGFKGAWLVKLLSGLGAQISGVSLPPHTTPSLFTEGGFESIMQAHHVANVCDRDGLCKIFDNVQPEIVFHLAAQALVTVSYDDPATTFSSNVMGTVNLLEACRLQESVNTIVMITTDKVYRNNEWCWPYREGDRLGGHDPYSASKAASELVIDSYRDAFLAPNQVALGVARAGNVIGGGDWSANRLIPDAIRAWELQQPLTIRRPDAIRPWQHVLDPLFNYLLLAQKLWSGAVPREAYNFGPAVEGSLTVRNVIQLAREAWGDEVSVEYGDTSDGYHEAGILKLDNSKARDLLGVRSVWDAQQAIKRTVGWYRGFRDGVAVHELCDRDIAAYLKTASDG